MPKKSLLLVIFIIIAALLFILFPKRGITNYPSAGRNIVAFGDSLVYGKGSTQGGFVGFLSQDLGTPVINLGVSGETTADALKRLNSLSHYDPKVVIVLIGGNDFLEQVPVEQTAQNIGKIIEGIQKTGAVVLLVGIEDPRFSKIHRALFNTLADTYHTAYVPDVFEGFYGDPKYMAADALHPNDQGYRIMADRIEPVLKKMMK